MKQTAVSWLVEKVKSKEWQEIFIWHKEELFEQAKEMEKEQISHAHRDGARRQIENSDLYYNETFKSE